MLTDENRQLDILDILNILSFFIGLVNLDENLTQGDKQDLMQEFDNKAQFLLNEIHSHLEHQDLQIKEILNKLEGINVEKNRQ